MAKISFTTCYETPDVVKPATIFNRDIGANSIWKFEILELDDGEKKREPFTKF